MTYLLSGKNIWKSSVESAIIIVISYAEIGAKEAGRGHGMVLLAASLRLYWLLCRQERAEHVGVGDCLFIHQPVDCGNRPCLDAG